MDPSDPEMSLVSYLVLAGIIFLYYTETAGMSEGYNGVEGQRCCLVFVAGGKEFEIGRNVLEKYGGCVCLSSLEIKII